MMNVQKGHVVVTDYDTIEPGPFGWLVPLASCMPLAATLTASRSATVIKAAWNYAIRIDGRLDASRRRKRRAVHIPAGCRVSRHVVGHCDAPRPTTEGSAGIFGHVIAVAGDAQNRRRGAMLTPPAPPGRRARHLHAATRTDPMRSASTSSIPESAAIA